MTSKNSTSTNNVFNHTSTIFQPILPNTVIRYLDKIISSQVPKQVLSENPDLVISLSAFLWLVYSGSHTKMFNKQKDNAITGTTSLARTLIYEMIPAFKTTQILLDGKRVRLTTLLSSCGIIVITQGSKDKKQSATYRLSDDISRGLSNVIAKHSSMLDKEALSNLEHTNLITRVPTTYKIKSVIENNEVPLIRKSLGSIDYSTINLKGFFRLMSARYSQVCFYREINNLDAARSLEARIDGDLLNLTSLTAGRIKARNTFMDYLPAYRVSPSGRVSAIAGGFQSMTREAKHQCSINTEIKNWDIKNCQIQCLQHEFQRFGIDTSWVDAYLKNNDSKNEMSDRIGVDVHSWKSMLYSLTLGGKTNLVTVGGFSSISNVLINALCADAKNPTANELDRVRAAHREFELATAGLKASLSEWKDKLVENHSHIHKGVKHWKNSCGKSFVFNPNQQLPKNKRVLAAHMIQGMEAYFIHTLTVKAKSFDVKVVDNEYDGVRVLGDLSDRLQMAVRAETGLNFEVVEKPYIDIAEHSALRTLLANNRISHISDLIRARPDIVSTLLDAGLNRLGFRDLYLLDE